jgi:hypothetical protein
VTKDLIKLGYGIFLWPEFPPYTLMIGFKDRTEQRNFDTKNEVADFIKAINSEKQKSKIK